MDGDYIVNLIPVGTEIEILDDPMSSDGGIRPYSRGIVIFQSFPNAKLNLARLEVFITRVGKTGKPRLDRKTITIPLIQHSDFAGFIQATMSQKSILKLVSYSPKEKKDLSKISRVDALTLLTCSIERLASLCSQALDLRTYSEVITSEIWQLPIATARQFTANYRAGTAEEFAKIYEDDAVFESLVTCTRLMQLNMPNVIINTVIKNCESVVIAANNLLKATQEGMLTRTGRLKEFANAEKLADLKERYKTKAVEAAKLKKNHISTSAKSLKF